MTTGRICGSRPPICCTCSIRAIRDDYLYGRDTFADLYPDHQVPPGLEPQQLVEVLRQESSYRPSWPRCPT
jgi:hypothetical protein